MEKAFSSGRVGHLLLVDDDVAQARLFGLLFSETGSHRGFHHVLNGLEALAFLRRDGRYAKAPRPDLIVLDMNMPGLNGCEVLRQIKSDPDLRRIPVIMFSACDNDQDVSRCYAEQANAYVRKPTDLDTNVRVIREIEQFWFQTARLSAF